MLKVPRMIRRRFHEIILSHLPRTYPASARPVTILIPLAVKDIVNARLAVASLRKHLLHPISEIVVAGQDSDLIRDFCRAENLRYINENDVLPKSLLDFTYMLGAMSMTGWFRQQFLKLTVFDYIDADLVLVQDSDTFLVRDVSFIIGNRQIFFMSDEYTQNYIIMLHKLFGPVSRHPRSFVAHFMLFQRDIMQSLNDRMRNRLGVGLIDAILAHLPASLESAMSEFEIYGNYMHNFHPERMTTRYWYNRKMPKAAALSLEYISRKYRKFNSVSAHIH